MAKPTQAKAKAQAHAAVVRLASYAEDDRQEYVHPPQARYCRLHSQKIFVFAWTPPNAPSRCACY